MARGNKLSAKTPPPVNPAQVLEEIIADVIEARNLSFEDWTALSASPFIRLAIPIDSGREHPVTQAGVDAAHKLTQHVWQLREDFRQTLSRKDFDRLSFEAIGQSVANAKTHLPAAVAGEPGGDIDDAFYAAVAADFHRYLDELADRARPDLDRHIPCHLFDMDQEMPGFSVGPVEFLPRAAWIARWVIDPQQLRAIQDVENRTTSLETLRTASLQPDSAVELYKAWSVLSSLRNFTWIATIKMSGHAPDQSHRKASLLVGLAIDAIGLRFDLESSRKLTKAGRQHLFSEDRLATFDTGAFLSGASTQMPGLGSKPGALAAKMAAEQAFLDAAGKVLSSYVAGRQTGRAPHLVERWTNALYWMGEARREASDFMAVVDYGCAADGLCGAGGLAKEIAAFAEVALNPEGHPTPEGMLSIADAVDRVYMEGRNKLAHGEEPGLLEDLADVRAIGDNLLVLLFDAVTFELAEAIVSRPQVFTIGEKHAYRALRERLRQRKQPV